MRGAGVPGRRQFSTRGPSVGTELDHGPAIDAKVAATRFDRWDSLAYGDEMFEARQLSQVPSWLSNDVLEPVLADLQQPTPVALDLRVQGTIIWFSEQDEPGSFGLEIPDPQLPRERLVVAFADQLQEQFFPETRAAWGQARPPCPGHPHPAAAHLMDDEAWWVCPFDQTRVARIGRLHPERLRPHRRRDR